MQGQKDCQDLRPITTQACLLTQNEQSRTLITLQEPLPQRHQRLITPQGFLSIQNHRLITQKPPNPSQVLNHQQG